jgi:hypothetical protein
MNARPLAAPARRSLAPEQAARYNGVGLQREHILEVLQAAGERGVISTQLARLAHAPSLTKRISELRRQGLSISTRSAVVAGSDGTVNTLALYVLESGPSSQLDLFKPP